MRGPQRWYGGPNLPLLGLLLSLQRQTSPLNHPIAFREVLQVSEIGDRGVPFQGLRVVCKGLFESRSVSIMTVPVRRYN